MRYLFLALLVPLLADAQTTIVLGPRQFVCTPGSKTFTGFGVIEGWSVPLGCNTIVIDVRGSGSGFGGGGDLNGEEVGDGGAGGGGNVDGADSPAGYGIGGYAGLSSYIKRGATTLVRAAIQKGQNGGAGLYYIGGVGGAGDTNVNAGLTLTNVTTSGSGSGRYYVIKGTINVVSAEVLSVLVGYGGGGGGPGCISCTSPPVLGGNPGQDGSIKVWWPTTN